jgi:ribA/ribD-fused uncharacterized protein
MPAGGIGNIYIMIEKFEGRWRFLSNFYPCEIEHQGIIYKSVEAFYVAMKCNNEQMLQGRHYTIGDFREMIARLPSPGMAKKIGQQMQVRKDWSEKKLEFMNWGVREKFKNEELKELLISTGDMTLIEGNAWKDFFWGVCNGKGENHLGKILMKVRDEIRGIEKKTGLEEFFK